MVRRGDVLLGLGVALLSWVIVLLSQYAPPLTDIPVAWGPVGLLMALQGVALIWWRKYPLLTQGIIFGLQLLILWPLPQDLLGSGFAQPVISFCLGLRLPLRQATTLLTALATLMTLITFALKQPDWPTGVMVVVASGLNFLVPMAGGAMLASRRRHEKALRRLEAEEHEKQLAATLAEERRRLAGELHDVAAHHLSGLVVQAAALERLIEQDPAQAKQAAARLRGQGKEALAGLRSVVKVLRHDDPQRGLRDIEELVATTSEFGVDITLESAEPPTLPPLTDAASYRIAQQAISNAIQHAPGAPIHVALDAWGLRVSNGPGKTKGQISRGGVGLEVMQERAAAVGAAFDAGPTQAGGWRVRLDWPRVDEEDA